MQKIRACIVAWRKVLPTEKCLLTSFWSLQISRQSRRIRKSRDHQKFLLMQGYLSKVKLQFSLFPYKQLWSSPLPCASAAGGSGLPLIFKHGTNIEIEALKCYFPAFFAIFNPFFRCPPTPGKFSADALALY